MTPHPVLPMNTVEVNQWLDTAVRWAGDYRDNPDGHDYVVDDVRAWYAALPVALKPLALDRLQAFAAGASDSTARINAALVLEWLKEVM